MHQTYNFDKYIHHMYMFTYNIICICSHTCLYDRCMRVRRIYPYVLKQTCSTMCTCACTAAAWIQHRPRVALHLHSHHVKISTMKYHAHTTRTKQRTTPRARRSHRHSLYHTYIHTHIDVSENPNYQITHTPVTQRRTTPRAHLWDVLSRQPCVQARAESPPSSPAPQWSPPPAYRHAFIFQQRLQHHNNIICIYSYLYIYTS
jgi:hypothetical protein